MIPLKNCRFVLILTSLAGLTAGFQCAAPYEERSLPPLDEDAQLADLSAFESFDYYQATHCSDHASADFMIRRWSDGGYRLYPGLEIMGMNDWECTICPDGGDDCTIDPNCPIIHWSDPFRRLSDTEMARVQEVFSRIALCPDDAGEAPELPCEVISIRWWRDLDDSTWAYWPASIADNGENVICERSLVEIRNLLDRLRHSPE